jgi:hypothetical protein
LYICEFALVSPYITIWLSCCTKSFIFTLQEFAQELVSLVEIMGQLHEAQVASLRYRNFGGWFRRVFNIGSRKRKVSSTNDYGATSTGRASFKSLRPVIQRRFCQSSLYFVDGHGFSPLSFQQI